MEPTKGETKASEQAPKTGDKVVIHVMPKKYASKETIKKKTNRAGALIMAGGVVLLLLIFAGLYFFLVKSGNPIASNLPAPSQNQPANTPPQEEKPPISEEDKTPDEDQPEETAPPEQIIAEENPATSTVIIDAGEAVIGKKMQSATDSDGDGLTDSEELLIGTNMNSADSDADSYTDSSELSNLYNPAGGGKLTDNPSISSYRNSAYKYSLLYPKEWNYEAIGTDDSILFHLGNNQFVQFIVQSSDDQKDLDRWYKAQFGVDYVTNERVVTKNGWRGIRSDDGLTVYFIHPDSAYFLTATYNLGLDNTMYYGAIFEMMINSLDK
jgi:hypothetical protein